MKDVASRSGRDGMYDEWLSKERDKYTNRDNSNEEDSRTVKMRKHFTPFLFL